MMETSLRYSGDEKVIRIHAKEKLPLDTDTSLQLRGELDTMTGASSHLSAMIRHLYPDLSASLGLGVQFDKLHYILRGKKAFPVTQNELVKFHVKGRFDIDKDFIKVTYFQIRENNWAFDADVKVRWNVRYDL